LEKIDKARDELKQVQKKMHGAEDDEEDAAGEEIAAAEDAMEEEARVEKAGEGM
jgi:hypothetical protein